MIFLEIEKKNQKSGRPMGRHSFWLLETLLFFRVALVQVFSAAIGDSAYFITRACAANIEYVVTYPAVE